MAASDGISADWAGRVAVTAVDANTAAAYAASGAPEPIAAAVPAMPATCARYPPASMTTGDRRSASEAATGATTAAGASCATATSPATAVPPRL